MKFHESLSPEKTEIWHSVNQAKSIILDIMPPSLIAEVGNNYMLILGILFGLLAALCQSCSYICSKIFLEKHKGDNIRLLLISHTLMGVLSLLALPFLLNSSFPPFEHVLLPIVGATAYYLMAQVSLFSALKITEASRISPLLGLKILFIALLSVIALDKTFSLVQWGAVCLALVAGAILNWSGTPPPFKSVGFVLLACLGYSLSDINIRILVINLSAASILRGTLCGVALTYVFCGFICVILLTFMKRPDLQLIKETIPFSCFWFVAMLCLFACFALINVMLGNIIQSTRGIMSIVIAAGIAKAGYEHLEKKVPRGVFIRRIAAAVLMVVSIIMFVVN